MLKIAYFQHFLTIFNIFSKNFSTYFFQVFFGFLGSARTKQNFILMVKSQFPKWFGLQKGKCNMQKTTFRPLKCCVIANGAIYIVNKLHQ